MSVFDRGPTQPLAQGLAHGITQALVQRVSGGPSLCEVCRQWAAGRLCRPCVDRFVNSGPRCARCALRLGSAATGVCGNCNHKPPPFQRTVCAVDYQFPWDGLVAAFKFQGQPELAAPLAACMARAVMAVDDPRPQALLPVPLSAQRLAQRGYNQAWELARRLAGTLQLPAWQGVLSRPLDTAHQAELDRNARLRNLRCAFLVEPQQRARLQGAHVALVDDVMTTGATVGQAAAELLRAGAARVDVWVLARTPAPGHAGPAGPG